MTPLKSLFQKWKQKIDSQHLDNKKKHDYAKTISTVSQVVGSAGNNEERIHILDYAINVIGRELAYSAAAELLHFGNTPEDREYIIPLGSKTWKSNQQFSLAGANIVSDTYDLDKLRKAIPQVFTNGFHQELGNYTGTYYPEINLVIVENGRHHLSAAMTKNLGSAMLYVHSLKEAFPHMKTDGAYWYIDGMKPWTVYDYRVATLYELARMKDLFSHDNC